jgi:hypothetical protein
MEDTWANIPTLKSEKEKSAWIFEEDTVKVGIDDAETTAGER